MKKEGDKRSVAKRIRDALELDDISCKRDLLELRGRGDLTVRSCHEILSYSEERIALRLCEYILVIRGKGLYCASYYANAVRVDGEIASLEIVEGKGDKK